MSTDSVPLEDLTPHQLVNEIHQLSAQYRAEVSTKRRTWPASIRERIMALRRQGVNAYRIAELSGVPYTTVVHWCRPQSKIKGRSGRFLPVVADRNATEPTTVVPTTVAPPTVGGLIVVLPGGIEVRGLSNAAQVAEFCRAIGLTPGRPA